MSMGRHSARPRREWGVSVLLSAGAVVAFGGATHAVYELSGTSLTARVQSCEVREEQRGRYAIRQDIPYCRIAWLEQDRSLAEEIEVDRLREVDTPIEIRVRNGWPVEPSGSRWYLRANLILGTSLLVCLVGWIYTRQRLHRSHDE